MKKRNKYSSPLSFVATVCLVILLCGSSFKVEAQAKTAKKDTSAKKAGAETDTTAVAPVKKTAYAKNTFDGNFIIDNQTVMVPIKGTFEFDIQHRFGVVSNGTKDLFGIFGGATMKLGFSYTVVNNLQLGFDATNENMIVDWNLKFAILKQTKSGSMPVSITYFGNAAMDTRKKDNTTLFVTTSDRFSYFNQIIIARKFSDKVSIQVAPSVSHFNNLEGYLDPNTGKVMPLMKHDNFSIAVAGRYKIAEGVALMANYDQPLTQNPANNPHPNLSFGIEMKTSGHDFEVFFGNYSSLIPQNNNVFNQNDFKKGQFLIGFNISRLWNF
ncbi:MAG: hypothetical protein JWP94_1698 [Mucilaginibacter sp.]|jgi:hypothetical protein|nr:hypothetical protein [Mucilaginibacter sp.]